MGRRTTRAGCGLLVLVAVGLTSLYLGGRIVESRFGQPLGSLWQKTQERWAFKYPTVFRPLTPIVEAYVSFFDRELPQLTRSLPELGAWRGHGAIADHVFTLPAYADSGEPLPLAQASEEQRAGAPSRTLEVDTTTGLLAALKSARAGDEILLAPGTYPIRGWSIALGGAGTRQQPIIVRARRLGDAKLVLRTLEGFYVNEPFWVFENLDIGGACQDHGSCEHAFHVIGRGGSVTIRNNRVHDFNAMIKVNGFEDDGVVYYPDFGLIEQNSFYNQTARETDNPVTLIDIVAANGWRVVGNLIADFAKAGGDRTSYGAFIKGNASGGVLERNLVVCGLHVGLPDTLRIGLSLGGGGTSTAACRDRNCAVESRNGVVRNNVVLHCSDTGIYLNRADDALVLNNTLYNTWGIQARFPQTNAWIANNLYTGWIAKQDGASIREQSNRKTKRGRCFRDAANGDLSLVKPARILDRGISFSDVPVDICGMKRPLVDPDIGAIEYQASQPACRLFP